MGQHKGTALAAHDWKLYLSDALDDLLESWRDADPAEMAAKGASTQDLDIARSTFAELCREWDGSEPTKEGSERFAQSYDASIRSSGRSRLARMRRFVLGRIAEGDEHPDDASIAWPEGETIEEAEAIATENGFFEWVEHPRGSGARVRVVLELIGERRRQTRG